MDGEILERLTEAAPYIQQWLANNRDEIYSTQQVEAALRVWLQRSVEGLVEDAIFHCVEGSSPFATGRNDFQLGLQRAAIADRMRCDRR